MYMGYEVRSNLFVPRLVPPCSLQGRLVSLFSFKPRALHLIYLYYNGWVCFYVSMFLCFHVSIVAAIPNCNAGTNIVTNTAHIS